MTEIEPIKVTLSEPELAGSYVVTERREDGTLVLRPEEKAKETEAAARELAERHRETLDYLAEN